MTQSKKVGFEGGGGCCCYSALFEVGRSLCRYKEVERGFVNKIEPLLLGKRKEERRRVRVDLLE